MNTPQPRFFFNDRPTIGDRLLRHAKRLKIDILHLEASDEDDSWSLCDVELHAQVPMSGDKSDPAVVSALLRHFLKLGKGGGDHA